MRRITAGLWVVLIAAAAGASEPADRDYLSRMAEEHAGDAPVASPAAKTDPAAQVVADDVVYAGVEGKDISGYLARPATGGERPGILVIHEWWGLNDNIRAMARRLAGEGYLALAVDLYQGEVAEDREKAGRLARGVQGRADQVIDNLRQAWHFLKQEQGASRVGVVGWCFGGGWSLRTALALGDGIDATVIFYGRLVTSADELEALASPLLGLFGSEDRGIPVETVREFEAALASLGKDASIHVYEGADHAFANPSGTRFNAEAAADAWAKTLAFFAEHLE